MPTIAKAKQSKHTKIKPPVNDFKKLKRKVGKHAKTGDNVTNTKFKVRSIHLKSQLRDTDKLLHINDVHRQPDYDHNQITKYNINTITTSRKLTLNDLLGQLIHYNTQTRLDALNGIIELYKSYHHIPHIQSSFSIIHQYVSELMVSDNKQIRDVLHTLLALVFTTMQPIQLQSFTKLYIQYINLAGNSIIPSVKQYSVQYLYLLVQLCHRDDRLADTLWSYSSTVVYWLTQLCTEHLHLSNTSHTLHIDANKQIQKNLRTQSKYRVQLIHTIDLLITLHPMHRMSQQSISNNAGNKLQCVGYDQSIDTVLDQYMSTHDTNTNEQISDILSKTNNNALLIGQWMSSFIPVTLDWYTQCNTIHNDNSQQSMINVINILNHMCVAAHNDRYNYQQYYDTLYSNIFILFPYPSHHTRSLNLQIGLLYTHFIQCNTGLIQHVLDYINELLIYYSDEQHHISNDHVTTTFTIIQNIINYLSLPQHTLLLHNTTQFITVYTIKQQSVNKLIMLDVLFQLIQSIESTIDIQFIHQVYTLLIDYTQYCMRHHHSNVDSCIDKLLYLLHRYNIQPDDSIELLINQAIRDISNNNDNTILTSRTVIQMLSLLYSSCEPMTVDTIHVMQQYVTKQNNDSNNHVMSYLIDILHNNTTLIQLKQYIDILLCCLVNNQSLLQVVVYRLMTVDRRKLLDDMHATQISYFIIYQPLLIKLLQSNYSIQLPRDTVLQLCYHIMGRSNTVYSDMTDQYVSLLVQQLLCIDNDTIDQSLLCMVQYINIQPDLLHEIIQQLILHDTQHIDRVITIVIYIVSNVSTQVELKPYSRSLIELYNVISKYDNITVTQSAELKSHIAYKIGAY